MMMMIMMMKVEKARALKKHIMQPHPLLKHSGWVHAVQVNQREREKNPHKTNLVKSYSASEKINYRPQFQDLLGEQQLLKCS